MSGRSRVVLVRHAESRWNAAGIFQGHGGPGLSTEGHEQAARLADHLLGCFDDVALIACSDLARVEETAAPTVARLEVPVEVDQRLRELDVGRWTGMPFGDVEASQPEALAAWRRFEDHDDRVESFVAFRTRVMAALRDCAAKLDGATALVFTHGGCIRIAVSAVLGLDGAAQRGLAPVHNASVTVLDVRDGALRLVSYNEAGSEHAPRGLINYDRHAV